MDLPPPIKFKVTPPPEESGNRTVSEIDSNFLAPPKRKKNSPRQKPYITELTPEERKYELFNLAKKGSVFEIKELITLGVDVNAVNSWGSTALMWAAKNGHLNVIIVLIQANANIFLKNNKNHTALHYAVLKNQEIVAFKLLDNMSDEQRATLKKDLFFKDILSKFKARQKKFDVNAQNAKGETMFMLAARYGHENTARLLISYGADPNMRNIHGKTAYEQAEEYRNNFKDTCLQMSEILRQKHTLIFSLARHQANTPLELNETVIIDGVKNIKLNKKSTP